MEIWHGIDRNLSMCGSVFVMGRLTRVTAPAAILHASRDEEEDPPFQKPKAKGRGTLTNKEKVKTPTYETDTWGTQHDPGRRNWKYEIRKSETQAGTTEKSAPPFQRPKLKG